jgi:hypothetical protein
MLSCRHDDLLPRICVRLPGYTVLYDHRSASRRVYGSWFWSASRLAHHRRQRSAGEHGPARCGLCNSSGTRSSRDESQRRCRIELGHTSSWQWAADRWSNCCRRGDFDEEEWRLTSFRKQSMSVLLYFRYLCNNKASSVITFFSSTIIQPMFT